MEMSSRPSGLSLGCLLSLENIFELFNMVEGTVYGELHTLLVGFSLRLLNFPRVRILIDAEIVRYHREPERMLTDDSHYCEQSLNRILASSASIKRRWLHRVKRSCERKAQYDRDQPRITKFFGKDDRQQKHYQHHKGRPPEATLQQSDHRSKSRTTTVQRLMTYFLHERASNTPNQSTSHPSPPPPPVSHN